MRTVVLICLLAAARFAVAQTCVAQLGNPIVNVGFGQGFDFGPALAPGITTLGFVANFCPGEGQYTIVSYSPDCGGSDWQPIGSDHSANQAGKYMLIHASPQPSDFYVTKVDGLCPGMNYQFAAWVANVSAVVGQVLPNIRFRIESTNGTVLANFVTGDIAQHSPLQWVQYAFYFIVPPGVTSVIFRLVNNATAGGEGNGLALDDISVRTAGPAVQVAVEGFPGDTISVCDQDEKAMRLDAAVQNCFPSQEELWQVSIDGGANWSDIAGATGTGWVRPVTGPGVFLYRLFVVQGNPGGSGCGVGSRPVSITILKGEEDQVEIGTSVSTICLGLPVSFTAFPVEGMGGLHYQWMVNGANVGRDSAGFTSSSLSGGDAVSCVMTSDAACAFPSRVSSNVIRLPAVSVPVQAVSIDPSVVAICRDSLVQFNAVPVNGGAHPTFQWTVNGVQAGAGPAFSDAGLMDGDMVNCIMTGSEQCSQPVAVVAPVRITIWPLPVITLDSIMVIPDGSGVRLKPVVEGDIVSYRWSPAFGLDDPMVAAPIASPVVTQTYRLDVVTSEGCHAEAAVVVEVYYPLRMPGSFTPNGDGKNDVFRVPPAEAVRVRSLVVYNRKGMREFYTTDAGAGWDGRYNGVEQPAGTYVWVLVFENPVTKRQEERKGTVGLVR